uniref:Uncharacterized protein n=1 Tax=Tanacetum cinerariifolium TaxID=118510 RepID=A0A699HXE9_TANCI|nr:hypothetical protein [Tanacetum cinerariifolium]
MCRGHGFRRAFVVLLPFLEYDYGLKPIGENVIEISSEKVEGHGDQNSLEYPDTANSGEDDVKPRVGFGRSFMRLTKGIANFKNGTVTIYPELDPFLDSSRKEEKIGDDWDLFLDDLEFRDILDIKGVKVLPFEKAEREALDIDIFKRYSLLEEERQVIKTMAYSDKYEKILDGICLDKMKLDGEMKKEEEKAITKIKGEVQNVKRGTTMLNHSKAEPMGLLKDVLCQLFGEFTVTFSLHIILLDNCRVGSTTLNDKVIVTLSNLKCKIFSQDNSVTQQWKLFCTNSGKIHQQWYLHHWQWENTLEGESP